MPPAFPPDLDWLDGNVPVSIRYGDPFYSARDGLAESRHVFLAGNDLPGRFRPGFRIGEIGFGTGLNALAAALCWAEAGQEGAIRYTAFEAHPIAPADMARALASFRELAPLAGALVEAWGAEEREIALPGLALRVVEGDARVAVPESGIVADAWFLDGFAPARNPEAWEPGLLAAVAARTAPGGTLATYSAAGHVRRALAAAGFAVERVKGFGGKRHMTRARRGG